MEESDKYYMVITFIFSIAASLTLFFLDFAGWTEQTYYGITAYYVFLGSEIVPVAAQFFLLLIATVHGVSVFSSYKAISGLNFKKLGFASNVVALILTLLSGIIFLLVSTEAEEVWFEAGFYVSLFSSIIGAFFFSKINLDTT